MENKKNKGRLYYVFVLSTYISSYWKKFAASISVHAIFKILPVGISILSSYMIGAAITGKLVEMRKFFYIIIGLRLWDVRRAGRRQDTLHDGLMGPRRECSLDRKSVV